MEITSEFVLLFFKTKPVMQVFIIDAQVKE